MMGTLARRLFLPALLAAGIERCWIGLRQIDDLRSEPVSTIVTLLVTSLLYLVSVYWVFRQKRTLRPDLVFLIVATAIGFRLTAWPLYPAFSDDIFRYHWEGKLQVVGGGNPYLVAPSDPKWRGLRDETYPYVVLPDFKTIYGPAIELEQRAAYAMVSALPAFSRVFWMKLPSALFDLLAIGAILLWLHARGDPLERVLVYAWCPLPVFEFWISGHNDAMLVCFLSVALWLEARGGVYVGAALSLAAATKLWPAMLFPFLHNRWKASMLGIAVFGVLSLPYLADVVENAQYASGFLGGWRNNDSLYGLLLRFAAQGDVYRAKYWTFAILGAAVVWVWWKKYHLDRAAFVLVPFMLAISANVHPWYLTWLIPLLVVRPSAPLLLWVALVPIHYVVLIDWFALGKWDGVSSSRWLVYVPVYAWMLASWLMRLRSNSCAPSGV